jgi:hypothetical protein
MFILSREHCYAVAHNLICIVIAYVNRYIMRNCILFSLSWPARLWCAILPFLNPVGIWTQQVFHSRVNGGDHKTCQVLICQFEICQFVIHKYLHIWLKHLWYCPEFYIFTTVTFYWVFTCSATLLAADTRIPSSACSAGGSARTATEVAWGKDRNFRSGTAKPSTGKRGRTGLEGVGGRMERVAEDDCWKPVPREARETWRVGGQGCLEIGIWKHCFTNSF